MKQKNYKNIIKISIFILLFCVSSVYSLSEYSIRIKTALTPSITTIGNDLIIAWVRDDGFIKIGVGELNSTSKEVNVDYNTTLNDVTGFSPSITSDNNRVILSFVDEDLNIRFKVFNYNGGKLKEKSSTVLPFKISNLFGDIDKPVDICMKGDYIFASWIGEEGSSQFEESSGKIVFACLSISNNRVKTESRKILEGFTFQTSPTVSITGSYLYASWINENGEVMLLPLTLTRSGNGVKFIENSTANLGIYSRNIFDESAQLPQSISKSDDEILYLFWYNGNDSRVYMRTYAPDGENIGNYNDESLYAKNVYYYNALIYKNKPYLIWLDRYSFGGNNSGVFSVNLSSIY
jgi:hypothetical protein